jgi:hypothetical protein
MRSVSSSTSMPDAETLQMRAVARGGQRIGGQVIDGLLIGFMRDT